MRKLKFHEQKLLKKVNFLEWKKERGQHEVRVMRRYHITGRDDYSKYVCIPLLLPFPSVLCVCLSQGLKHSQVRFLCETREEFRPLPSSSKNLQQQLEHAAIVC
jgi:hypothetical protein